MRPTSSTSISHRFCSALVLAALLCSTSAHAGAGESSADQSTAWETVAGRDDFTEEEYFIILPQLRYRDRPATIPGSKTLDQIRSDFIRDMGLPYGTDEERRATDTVLDQDMRLPISLEYERVVKRVHESRERIAGEIANNASHFLRPFVAYENGTLLVGVTTIGSIDVAGKSLRSSLPPQLVQMRIDGAAPIEISSLDTPATILLGATSAMNSSTTSAGVSNNPYAAFSGDNAASLLSTLVSASKIVIRRKPTESTATAGESASEARTFTLGHNFRSQLDRIGLVFDEGSRRWILDPRKAGIRTRIATSVRDRLPTSDGCYVLAGNRWVELTKAKFTHRFDPGAERGAVIRTPIGKRCGEITFASPPPTVIEAAVDLRFCYNTTSEFSYAIGDPGAPLAGIARTHTDKRGARHAVLITQSPVSQKLDKEIDEKSRLVADGRLILEPAKPLDPGNYVFVCGFDMFEFTIVSSIPQ